MKNQKFLYFFDFINGIFLETFYVDFYKQ